LESRNQTAAAVDRKSLEKRSLPRYKLEVEIKITSHTRGVLKGYTVDISESGISAMLMIEVPVGELVKLDFTLPLGPVTIYAMVRQRNAFRYGFQFIHSDVIQAMICPTCHRLAVEQSGAEP
jgi:hypothetical protein